jgi:hypothetical protein
MPLYYTELFTNDLLPFAYNCTHDTDRSRPSGQFREQKAGIIVAIASARVLPVLVPPQALEAWYLR